MNNNLDPLYKLLKTENTMISIYDKYLQTSIEEPVREHIEDLLSDHKRHAKILSDRISQLGGHPQREIDRALQMNALPAVRTTLGENPTATLFMIYDTEDNALATNTHITNSAHNLDTQSQSMIHEISTEDHEHLHKLQNLITSYDHGNITY